MKRDMDLIRMILFKIEEEYVSTVIFNLKIDGYELETVAYHCKLMHEAGLVDCYSAQYASNSIYSFCVGGLTWEGHDFLEKIRKDTVWNQTKEAITQKGLPMILDVVKDVATSIASALAEGAVKGMIGP